MKKLQDLIQHMNKKSIVELVDDELKDTKEPFKTQKKQIIKKLNELFDGQLLDGFNRNTYGNFLSRALTAYVISNMFGIDVIDSVQYITDDVNDYGIDALYYKDNKVYVFQTKFSAKIETKDLRQVKEGIRKLLDLQNAINDFNKHFIAHKETLTTYLMEDETKIVPVCILFSDTISKDLEAFYNNEVSNRLEYGDFIEQCIFITKKDIFNYDIIPPKINSDFLLDKFFYVQEPICMYCGCVKASFLKSLFQHYGNNLFSKNIRFVISDSSINTGIQNTVEAYPDKLLYYHNGITFICDSISVKPISAASPTLKNLSVKGLSIVNGAQTISSLADVSVIPDEALIQIRIIETDDIGIATKITQYNNSQNSVSPKDLRTLDEIHKRIKYHFLQNGYYYIYRTGENFYNPDSTIDFEDLMIALACYYGLSKTAKFNKGQLWSNDKTYEDLLKIEDLGLFLQISKIKQYVDRQIKQIADKNIYVQHYNRLILEIVFAKYSKDLYKLDEVAVRKEVQDIFKSICDYITQEKQEIGTYHRRQNAYLVLKNNYLGIANRDVPVQQNLFD